MANKAAWDVNDHRRFARQFLPPDEFRDGYLGYLDEIELKEPAVEAGAPAKAGSPVQASTERGRRTQDGIDGQRWRLPRYVLAAVGSVAFAYAAWFLTSTR